MSETKPATHHVLKPVPFRSPLLALVKADTEFTKQSLFTRLKPHGLLTAAAVLLLQIGPGVDAWLAKIGLVRKTSAASAPIVNNDPTESRPVQMRDIVISSQNQAGGITAQKVKINLINSMGKKIEGKK